MSYAKTEIEAARLDAIASVRNSVRFPLSRVAQRVVWLMADLTVTEFDEAIQRGETLTYQPRTYTAGDIERAAEAVCEAFGWSERKLLGAPDAR